MRKRGARRPRQDCSMLYMHTYFPPLVLFLTHALVFEQTEKKSTYRRCTCEIWLIQRHYHDSIFHTFIFICSYLKTDFSFVSILTHFTVLPYISRFARSVHLSEHFRLSFFFVWVGCFNSDMCFLSR